jgi:hypothetical protein
MMTAFTHKTIAPHVPASIVALAKAQIAKQAKFAAAAAREEKAESPQARAREVAVAKTAARAVDISA